MTMISHSRPSITREDSDVVAKVVASGAIAQGPAVKDFERAVASFMGVRGGVAVSSGTAAIHLALVALGVTTGDEVILPSYLCTAPLNAVHYLGAKPILADVDPHTGNIDAAEAARLVSEKTRAIIVPHLFGRPVAMDGFRNLGVPVIEDCAQAIGARYQGRMVGTFGDVAICSFYATKVFTTGEGGMVLSDNEGLLEAVRDLRDYDEKTPYRIRFNYKMTDMQAALGSSQLARLPDFIAARQRIAAFYDQELANLVGRLPVSVPESEAISFRYILRIDSDVEDFIEQMARYQVVCRRPIFKPLHRLLKLSGLDHTDRLHNDSVSIPIYPLLTDQQQELVIQGIKKTLAGVS